MAKFHLLWSDDAGGHQPDEREKAEAILTEASAILTDPKRASLLPMPFLLDYAENKVGSMVSAIGKWVRVRTEQSYSKQKKDAAG